MGAGLMGRWHAHFAHRLGARVVAIVDRTPGAAAALASRMRNSVAFHDLDAMLESGVPNVVHVCTPSSSHLDIAMKSIRAGAHVLVEKPFVPTAVETLKLLQAARRAGVHACPVHQFVFQRGVTRAARELGELGETFHAVFTICSAGGGEEDGARLDEVIADILPHPISILQRLRPNDLLRPEDWSATSTRFGELHVRGRSGPMTVSVYVSMNSRPTRCELDVYCRGGTVHLNFFHGYGIVRHGKPSRTDKIVQPLQFAAQTFLAATSNLTLRALSGETAYPGLSALISQFHAAACGKQAPPFTDAETLAAAIVRETIVRQSIPEAFHATGSPGDPKPLTLPAGVTALEN